MFRKTISLTAFLSGIIVLLTSVVLYIEPQGRIAYWADWHFLGLTKEQWDGIHITVGALFCVAVIIHAINNWKLVVAYMRNKAKEMVVFTKPMIWATAITLFFTFGTLAELPPMQQILDLSATIKDSHAETYGNPPYGHAELATIRKFADQMRLDYNASVKALRNEGLDLGTEKHTLKDIAKENGVTPKHLFDIMKKASKNSQPSAKSAGAAEADLVPAGTGSGFGRMTLKQACEANNVPLDQLLQCLKDKGVKASPDSKMRELASQMNTTPHDVLEACK